MPLTAERIDALNATVKTTLSPILAMAGVANPIAASALFATDIVFRFVKLGVQIKKAVKDAQKTLDDAVRAEGIFRIPINIGLKQAAAISAFGSGTFQMSFPIAYDQLKPEVEIARDLTNPNRPLAVEVLTRAYQIVPDVYNDFRLDSSPLLDDMFGKWLDPGNPQFGALVREAVPFLAAEEASIPHLQRLLPRYAQMKLEMLGVRLASITQAQLATLNEAISELVWGAILGEAGVAKSVTDFAVARKLEQIDADIAKLNADKGAIEQTPEAQRTDAQKKQLARIAKRVEELTAHKARIEAAKA